LIEVTILFNDIITYVLLKKKFILFIQ
jgi:hypothetical protein